MNLAANIGISTASFESNGDRFFTEVGGKTQLKLFSENLKCFEPEISVYTHEHGAVDGEGICLRNLVELFEFILKRTEIFRIGSLVK